ncbi:MAG: DUF4388 domain-containing protein [Acidobacteria bacterium]|nr:MAG: DUF4388 domain-containing protein [Acidobacteriota bacterium]
MAFQGSLKELPLPDIIQLVSVSGKTGAFVLESGQQRGEIYLRDGEIVHAVANDVQGEEAVYELAILQEGEFTFMPGVETEVRTVKKSNTNLLMEAARRIDEWKVLSKRIPSTRLIPIFTNQGSSTSVSFTPNEWAVICKIDERRSIEELAAVLGLSPFEVCKLLYGLVTAGLVELKENLGQLQVDRLQQMSAAELAAAAEQIEAQARDLLASHAKAPEVETTAQRVRTEMEAGRGADAIVDLIRSLEQVVSSALGPNQSRAFLERVNQLLAA